MMIKTLKNENGLLTLDFIFASMIVFGFAAIIFSFAMTLSVVEVIQYVTFSTARNYSLGHIDENSQRQRAQEKYDELINNPSLVPMIDSGWFEAGPLIIDDFNGEYGPNSSYEADNFVGTRIQFSAPILYKRIPMIGTTGTDPDGFTANIQSFLAREPTFRECETFIGERAQRIRNLRPTYGLLNASQVVPIMDNGC